MANITFGTTAGNWNVPGNWVGGSQPGTGDTAVFTAASANCTIPASTTITVGAVDFSGLGVSSYTGTFTFAATTSVLTIGSSTLGACTFVAGMTLTLTGIGTINMIATTATTTYQLKTGGLLMPNIVINSGSTTTIQQGDAINATGATLTLTAGIWDWNSQSITAGSISSNNSNTRTLAPGSSAVSLVGGGTVWNFNTAGGLSVIANTAVVTASGSGVTFAGAGKNYNGLSIVISGSGTATISGASTYANITRTFTAAKTDILVVNNTSTLTITGTFTATGSAANAHGLVQSSAVGAAQTITAAAVSLTNVDFMDITGAGLTGNAAWTGSSLGDCQGNSNITFTTAVTRYGVVAGNGSSTATWSTTSGGSGGASVPLPQDTMILDANSAAGTYTMDMPRLGVSLTCTGFTRSLVFTVATVGTCSIFGNFTLASGMTFNTASTSVNLCGRGSQTITSAGNAWANASAVIQAPGGTYTLQDALTFAGRLTLTFGTFTTNNMSVTSTSASSAAFVFNAGTTANLGTSTLTCNATATLNMTAFSGTTNSSLATFLCTGAGTFTRTFSGGGTTWAVLTYTVANSPGSLVISNNGGTISTLNIGSGRVWTNTAGITCTIGTVNASGVSNGFFAVPGVLGNYASTPDISALDITGDISLWAKMSMPSWTAASASALVITKYGNTNATDCYRFSVSTTGLLQLTFGVAGTSTSTAISSAPVTFAAGAIGYVYATRQQSSGTIQFWTSPDGVTWTQLGSNVTLLPGTAIWSTSQDVEFGSYGAGTGVGSGFALYEARIYNGYQLAGSIVCDPVFATKTPCATAFVESSSNAATVTINGAMAQAGDGSIVLNSSTPGTQATVSKAGGGIVSVDYLIMQDSKANQVNTWYAGTHSNNVSDNTNWIFGLPPSQNDQFMLLGVG